MVKKCKQKPKKDKYEKDVNKTKKDIRNKKEKKDKKETIKKEEKIIEKEEKEKNKKLLEKIYKVKYLSVCVGNEDCDDGVEIFRENGEKLDPFDDEVPLYYGNFHFTVDVEQVEF